MTYVTISYFLNLHDIKYKSETMTPAVFYQKEESYIMANKALAGEVIVHNNNKAQAADKTIGTVFQAYILYNVIQDLNLRLNRHIQNH